MIWTDANWREPGTRPRGWIIVQSEMERNSNAALCDRPPATTFGQVAGYVGRRTFAGIVKRIRAIVAAVQAYRESMKCTHI